MGEAFNALRESQLENMPTGCFAKGDPVVRVVQFPVHNLSYPRNRRIRSYFEANGYECIPIRRGKGRKTTLIEKFRAAASLWRVVRSADVVVLTEMSLKYAPITWALSKIYGAVHIVDGFVGLYETDVEDKKLVSEKSLRAKLLRIQDRLAVQLADIYLVDTDMRAANIQQQFPGTRYVLSLPVGAPSWAHYRQYRSSAASADVLYYGNYIPLHGLKDYVMAINSLDASERPTTRMIGDGDCFAEVRDLVDECGLRDVFTFQGPVPESDLAAAISETKVVLGIFGTSKKAGSVIANKVWQGLASGRRVVTRQSKALCEVASICDLLLVQVPVSDPKVLGRAIAKAVQDELPLDASTVSYQLEDYVTSKFDEFSSILNSELVCRASRRRVSGQSN